MTQTHQLLIQTAEGITFPLRLASPVTRCLAWLIDLFCIMVMMTMVSAFMSLLNWISFSVAWSFYVIASFGVTVGYGMLAEWYWRGQTVGKRILRLRVVDARGLRLQASQIIIRNLLRFIDSLPLTYLVGGVMSLLSSKAQRLGDIAANTLVIWTPTFDEPDLTQILAGKYNSFRDHPHLVARLRQKTTPQEAVTALEAILRREQFDLTARLELYAELAQHFRRTVKFPREATEGLTDEQYLRNIVELLFKT